MEASALKRQRTGPDGLSRGEILKSRLQEITRLGRNSKTYGMGILESLFPMIENYNQPNPTNTMDSRRTTDHHDPLERKVAWVVRIHLVSLKRNHLRLRKEGYEPTDL